MTGPFDRDRSVSGSPARLWRSLHHLVTSAGWAWLPRPWAAEWLVLLGLVLVEGLSRMLPVVAAVVRHG